MNVKWIHPDRDEESNFDLPDNAVHLQVGALCCGDDRRMTYVDVSKKEFGCSSYRTAKLHQGLPRLSYRIDREDDGQFVARVAEGDALPFKVYPR